MFSQVSRQCPHAFIGAPRSCIAADGAYDVYPPAPSDPARETSCSGPACLLPPLPEADTCSPWPCPSWLTPPVLQKKPYSAVTVTVERLTSEQFEEDDLSGIPDLVEVIKLQASGPTEAARAIRKKLKYGNVHRQLRALTLLDGLIQNAGPRFQRAFADEPLLERLRVCGTSDLSDPEVRKKCSELFRSWATEYKNTPGLERVAMLYRVRDLSKVEDQAA